MSIATESQRINIDGLGHGQGQGSGSGAGMWLSGSSTSLVSAAADAGNRLSEGRRYHISAEASKPTHSNTENALLLNLSGSGEVDLDLSFDFVSQMEKSQRSPSKEGIVGVQTMSDSNNVPSPRGMSAARWDSRSKKQPPTALTLSTKKQQHLQPQSQFSPISPLDGRDERDMPLVLTPLGSSRRAADSGIVLGESKEETIRRQRMAVLQKQQKLSPEKQAAHPRRKLTLAENHSKNNAQIAPVASQGDVFEGTDYDYKKHLQFKKSPSMVSTKTGGVASSFATAQESNGGKSKRSKRQQGSVESARTFDTALTRDSSAAEDLPTIALQPPLANNNMIRLDSADQSDSMGLGLIITEDKTSSPLSAASSSPGTPFSALFSDKGVARRGSEMTHGTLSEGSTTPGTAFSSLFDERVRYPHEKSSDMLRGNSAPLSGGLMAHNVIPEEEGSAMQVRSAPAASFLVDLPTLEDEQKGLLHRQNTDLSVSDQSSSPTEDRQAMIVSTTSSPTVEVDFLFRKPSQVKHGEDGGNRRSSGARASPWPQSPLLLSNFLEGDVSDELKSTLGLGIDLGFPTEEQIGNSSQLSVERAVLLEADSKPIEPQTSSLLKGIDPLSTMEEDQAVQKSASFMSSVEGFAINVTPAGKEEANHQGNTASAMSKTEPKEMITPEVQSRSRWSSKLWSITSKSPLGSLRSPSRATAEEQQIPTMKTLTLVTQRRRSQIKEDVRRGPEEDDGYNSMPSSAVLPSTATFLQAPSKALQSQARSSRHVSRSSRLRYVPDVHDHVQVDMQTTAPQDGTALEAIKSPRLAASPTGFTPKMEYLFNAKNNRHSWGYATAAGITGAPLWLAPPRSPVVVGEEPDLPYANRNSTLSAIGAELSQATASLAINQHLDTVVEDGIRRRANHRRTNSVPLTPTMVPETWTVADPDVGEEKELEGESQRHAMVQVQSPEEGPEGRPHRRTMATTLNLFGPASAAVAPYFAGLTGARNRSKMVKMTPTLRPAAYDRDLMQTKRQTQLHLFSEESGAVEGVFAVSGRALENASPSRTLFFAGFLAMPWLWFIGGWGLQNDGSVYIEHDIFWEHTDDEVMAFELLRKRKGKGGEQALLVSGRTLHKTSPSIHRASSSRQSEIFDDDHLRYSMGKPDSIIQMEEEYQHYQEERKAQSLTDRHTAYWTGDELLPSSSRRKTRSLLDGEERVTMRPASSAIELRALGGHHREHHPQDYPALEQSQYPSIELHRDNGTAAQVSHTNGSTLAIPLSSWDEYDDDEEKKKRKQMKTKSFVQQVFEANSTMFARLANSSSPRSRSSISSTRSSQYEARNPSYRQKDLSYQPVLIRAITDWSRLERYVLMNRIMALSTFFVVFGAFTVAIIVVITDW